MTEAEIDAYLADIEVVVEEGGELEASIEGLSEDEKIAQISKVAHEEKADRIIHNATVGR